MDRNYISTECEARCALDQLNLHSLGTERASSGRCAACRKVSDLALASRVPCSAGGAVYPELSKVPVVGNVPVSTIANISALPGISGGAWSRTGDIVFGSVLDLACVPAAPGQSLSGR